MRQQLSDAQRQTENLHLGFLIFPGFPMACLTSMIEPLRAANEISGREAFRWSLITEDGAPVESSAKVAFHPSTDLTALRGMDHVIVLSPPNGGFANPRAGNAALRAAERHGTVLGGVSGGVFPLARAGLLEGHLTSVHWCYANAFADEFPELRSTDEVIVAEGRRLTVSGAAAAFDAALMLIDQRLGPEVMTEVACWFQHPLVRGAGVRQKIPALRAAATSDMLPEPVASAVQIMSENLEDPISIADICDQISLSPRHLERLFKTLTGKSPLTYYRNLRLAAARQLVMYSNKSMNEIALAIGYASASPFRQRYLETYGLPPEEDRRKINTFRVRDNRPVPSV
ncbi:GlxA family transcriptional regulator [Roseinatronobacter sp.]|uniref:GlxA family transcriptional regulator n=1 Tax=Roseinatronobacter sp. TaxID=1945755 RepID=UPI0025D396A6|nr:GlxA family transcriptional regulator [Rhodobaca sp.]